MEDEIFDPLASYRDLYRADHAKNTAEFFESILKQSGVDEAENESDSAKVRALEGERDKKSGQYGFWRVTRVLTVLCLTACVAGAVHRGFILKEQFSNSDAEIGGAFLLGILLFLLLWLKKLNPKVRVLGEALRQSQKEFDAALQTAWSKTSPLNRLYDWDIAVKLAQKTVPILQFDSFFSRGRLSELREQFGLDDTFNKDKSVLFTQSGSINGNPFVLADTLNFRMGTKTYHGSLTIYRQEIERDAQGNSRWVTKSETLWASVDKPYPEYLREQCLIYGNEAAPELSFSRSPSALSSLEDGFFNNLRKKRALKKLEAYSSNLDDDSNYTLMANREFETLFHATDRNHEVQFRLLFTPLAQQQMTLLLKDQKIGFGDDFRFIKSRMLNYIFPEHLRDMDMSANPALFRQYDIAKAREFFNQYHNNWFKAFYFAFAPLMIIPLYQQHRSHADIYKDVYSHRASFWEHETHANFHGEKLFRHQDSVTQNILKTESHIVDDNTTEISVTAHGFSSRERTDYVSVSGHQVPVNWTEYLPVRRVTPLRLLENMDTSRSAESEERSSFFQKAELDEQSVFYRCSLVSGIPSDLCGLLGARPIFLQEEATA